jgi:putative ABC transport system permease protein
MDGLVRDLRHAVRNLLRSPGFAVVTVLTLALGIGANTAIFSVVNSVILRPLGYPQPEQLVYISTQFPTLGFDQFWVSPPEFFELRERTQSFSSIGAYSSGQANLTASDRPRRINSMQASASLFKTLAVAPMLGRTFEESETLPNGPFLAILSYELWQGAFGGKPDIVGQQIEVNSRPRTVIGIMPPHFDVADRHTELWVPLALDPANRQQGRGSHYLYLIGRLKNGASLASASAELETVLANWRPSLLAARPAGTTGGIHAPDPKNHRVRFDMLQAQIVGSARTAVLVLQGAVVFVLLIACANLANLLLARAESRHREFAVRAALGASRLQLLRQFLVEGLVLALGGAALGLGVAVAGLRALMTAYPDSLPRSGDVALDVRVLAFTLVIGLLTGAVFAFAPLLHIAPDATSVALKEGSQRAIGGGRHWMRRGLVTAEVALAVALVIGAGLLLRTVMNLSNVDSGFNRARLVTFALSLPGAKYQEQAQLMDFYRRVIDQLSTVPGVQNVAAMDGLPPLRQVNANDTDIEGYTPPPNGRLANVDYYQNVTSRYVETMGIPVVEGRSFLPSDAAGPYVALINETLARTFYAGQSPIGRRIRTSAPASFNIPYFTIVGVLKDVKQGGVDKATGTELYFDVEQAYKVRFGMPNAMNLVLRTSLSPQALSPTIYRIVNALDPSLPVVKLQSMDDVFAEAIGRPRLLAQLLGIFAGLALLVAAIGAYGVLSYMVTERRREIGIRMALGADRQSVLRMVLRQGLGLAGIGVVAGLAVAFAMNRVLASLLFGVKPSDPLTIGAVVTIIAGVALLACYVPARSATRVDPMIVLREE